MIELAEHLPKKEADPCAAPCGELVLPYDLRQKSRQLARLSTGEEARLLLPRGTVLRGGDLLRATDGRVVRVVSAPERLLSVDCPSPRELARVAYHLGNRHVAVEIGEGHLCLAFDHVLRAMLGTLGAAVEEFEGSFEPEGGAYGHGGHHPDRDAGGGACIHDHV